MPFWDATITGCQWRFSTQKVGHDKCRRGKLQVCDAVYRDTVGKSQIKSHQY